MSARPSRPGRTHIDEKVRLSTGMLMPEALKICAPTDESMPPAPGVELSASASSIAAGLRPPAYIRPAIQLSVVPIGPALLSSTYSPGMTCSPLHVRIAGSITGFQSPAAAARSSRR